MWKQIKTNEQINQISVGSTLVKYLNDGEQSNSETLGDKDNAARYKVSEILIDSFEIESVLRNSLIGGFTMTSMKRQVSRDDLLNGSWWLYE